MIDPESEKHNAFVREMVPVVGRRLFDQGSFESQMVALESLTAGLLAAMIAADPRGRDADAYVSALAHGIRGRVLAIARDKPPPQPNITGGDDNG